MKIQKKLFLMLCMALPLGMMSCSDDDDDATTHTDASVLISGTYQGTMVNADTVEIANDVVATISHLDRDSTQAILLTVTSESISMNQQGVFNAAKAGNKYVFGSGSISTKTDYAIKNSGGVVEGNTLTLYLTLNSKYRFSTATAAKPYIVTLTKTGD